MYNKGDWLKARMGYSTYENSRIKIFKGDITPSTPSLFLTVAHMSFSKRLQRSPSRSQSLLLYAKIFLREVLRS